MPRLLKLLHRKRFRSWLWLAIFLLVLCISGIVLGPISRHYAETNVIANARLSLAMMNATRNYTSESVRPALEDELASSSHFIPETVPAYAAREVFERLRQAPGYQSFFYTEATLNPTNLRDKADSFESELIADFRKRPDLAELSGYRLRGGSRVLYIAQPLSVGRESCLRCHGRSADAPPSLVATYGPDHGFGWKLGEIVSAQTIYVPAASVFEKSDRFLILVMLLVGVICAGAITAIDRLFMQNRRIKVTEERLIEENQRLDNTLRELKEVRTTQSQLIHTEKMSSLEKIVSGFAHELNNPLTFIQSNIPALQQYVDEILDTLHFYRKSPDIPVLDDRIDNSDLEFIAEDMPRLLASMHQGSARISGLVSELQKFVRLDEVGWKTVDLNQEINRVLLLLSSKFNATGSRPAIALVKNYDTLPGVYCDPRQLSQAFSNLIVNAIDAARECEQAAPEIVVTTNYRASNNCVSVTIADNGTGIPLEVQSRIFDPFFTTKAVGSGTGLGLSVTYQIVRDLHHGTISCHSAPNLGAAFTLELPCQPAQISLMNKSPLNKSQLN